MPNLTTNLSYFSWRGFVAVYGPNHLDFSFVQVNKQILFKDFATQNGNSVICFCQIGEARARYR